MLRTGGKMGQSVERKVEQRLCLHLSGYQRGLWASNEQDTPGLVSKAAFQGNGFYPLTFCSTQASAPSHSPRDPVGCLFLQVAPAGRRTSLESSLTSSFPKASACTEQQEAFFGSLLPAVEEGGTSLAQGRAEALGSKPGRRTS